MDDEKQATETIELTSSMLQALLNLTTDPEAYTDKTRRFVTALHKAEALKTSGRWRVEFTEEDMRTLDFILNVRYLRMPYLQTRFENHLARQSDLYLRIVRERLSREH